MMSRNFDRARERGREAALQYRDRDTCPYPDRRTKDGRATFSRAFRKAWAIGYWQGVGDRHKAHAAPVFPQFPIAPPRPTAGWDEPFLAS